MFSPSARVRASVVFLATFVPVAAAGQINTGEPSGAYHQSFCPALEAQLAKAKFEYKCTPSAGTIENMTRVSGDPRQLGYGQLDAMALAQAGGARAQVFTRVRTDDARECVFAVTRNRQMTNYGEIAVFASQLRFVLPPTGSGTSSTFRFLQSIDPDGLGKARSVENATTAEEAIRIALSAEDAVAFFVQFPDPDNARFTLVQQLGGHLVPVIDRNILRQQIDGQKVYFAQETQVTNAEWLASGRKVVTSCTPLVLFTGSSDKITDAKARQDHLDLIATIKALRPDAVLPQESLWTKLWRRTREISAVSAERLLVLSEDARERAKPYVEKAKQATEKALEAAKPTIDKAKELGSKAYERSKEEVKELLDKAKPAEQQK
jgi:hypothetical protein